MVALFLAGCNFVRSPLVRKSLIHMLTISVWYYVKHLQFRRWYIAVWTLWLLLLIILRRALNKVPAIAVWLDSGYAVRAYNIVAACARPNLIESVLSKRNSSAHQNDKNSETQNFLHFLLLLKNVNCLAFLFNFNFQPFGCGEISDNN